MKNDGNNKGCHYHFYFNFFSVLFLHFLDLEYFLGQCLVPNLKDEADSSKLDVYIFCFKVRSCSLCRLVHIDLNLECVP